MATAGSNSVAFAISGPITRADLPGLCDRVCGLLTETDAEIAHCDVTGVQCDAVTVDALARLQLAARRQGCRVCLRNASAPLRALVEFMGLTDVFAETPSEELSVWRSRHGAKSRENEEGTMTDSGNERTMISANGVDLCIQTFGDSPAPAILLIAGAASSMDWWEDEFCGRLASGSRFVIRFDLRDTGQSISYESGAPEYTGTDLIRDAVGVLDALDVSRAHIVGISMGGGIGQRLALDHPARVASLTLLSTSPGSADLPPMSEELESVFAEPPVEPNWSDQAAVIAYIVESLHPFAGSLPFDEEGMRALVGRVVDRSNNIQSSMTNHWILEDGDSLRPRLGEIVAPTLVLHGTEDPLFPLAHGEALAHEIPGARLLALEGVGHEHPPRAVWDQVVAAILEHTAPRDESVA